MLEKAIQRLEFLCNTIPPLLAAIDEQIFSHKENPTKWSKKEIIGHLIDSAANNHQRFVRGQFEQEPAISYDQNKWNDCNYYNYIESSQVIAFWMVYNKQLAALIKQIPKEKLSNKVNSGGKIPLTLEYLFIDYVAHAEHHLRQVVNY
jgi:DinB superfamily